MKLFQLIIVIFITAVLLTATGDFPDWAAVDTPPSQHVSKHFLLNAMEDTHVPNIVSAVLADYRGFDTMLETGVVFAAGVGIILVLRRRLDGSSTSTQESDENAIPENEIIRITCNLIMPVMQLFALYVVAHGHHSPGGGFQGGVILGAAYILYAIAYDLQGALKRMSAAWSFFYAHLGVLIFSGTGLLCLLYGQNFLDYSALQPLLPGMKVPDVRSFMILVVEIGVTFTVMSVMFSIYADLSSRGDLDRGL